MTKTNREGEDVTIDAYFQSDLDTMVLEYDFDDRYDAHVDNMMRRIEEFVKAGSGWMVTGVVRMELYVAPYQPTSAACYVKTPKYVADKRAVVNIQNEDSMCFAYCVLAGLHPVDYQSR